MSLYADNGLQALEVLNELHRIFDVARLVDPLTSLLNRRSFDCAMHRLRGRVAVIFYGGRSYRARATAISVVR